MDFGLVDDVCFINMVFVLLYFMSEMVMNLSG